MKVSEILELMAGMQTYRVGQVVVEGVTLTAMPDSRIVSPTAAAGNMSAPTNQPTADQAMRAIQAARIEATRLTAAKLEEQKHKTARARTKAAGGIGTKNISSLTDAVFKDAMATKPKLPSAPDNSSE